MRLSLTSWLKKSWRKNKRNKGVPICLKEQVGILKKQTKLDENGGLWYTIVGRNMKSKRKINNKKKVHKKMLESPFPFLF